MAYVAFIVALLSASTVFAQGFETLPDGSMVYSPQPQDLPVTEYYRPQGGPPLGYTVHTPHNDIYYPYQGGPSYTVPHR